MADTVIPAGGRRNVSQQPAPQGPAGRLVSGILKFIGWLMMGLIGNIVAEWLCMGVIWPEQGVNRSQQMLEAEVRYLEEDLQESVVTSDPASFAAKIADSMNWALYRATGLKKAMIYSETIDRLPDSGQEPIFKKILWSLIGGIHDYILAAMIATHVFALRLAVLLLSIPTFMLSILIGAIDGIVQRDVNRWVGGRELGQRYHLAKGTIKWGVILPWVLHLACPVTIHPYVIILPFALMLGFSVAITTATFKKYF